MVLHLLAKIVYIEIQYKRERVRTDEGNFKTCIIN